MISRSPPLLRLSLRRRPLIKNAAVVVWPGPKGPGGSHLITKEQIMNQEQFGQFWEQLKTPLKDTVLQEIEGDLIMPARKWK
jgi:hypothetical protein